MTMAISTVIGTMASIYLTRSRFKGIAAMRGLFMSPIVLPGIVLGLSLYVFYVSSGIGLARLRRPADRPCAGHLSVRDRHRLRLAGRLRPVARGSSAQPRRRTAQAFRLVTLKIISPAVGAGAIFAFIISFGQFDLSLYLGTANLTGLPLAMYISLRYKFEPTAAAAGIFAIALVVISMVLSSRLVNLRRLVASTRLRW
jgi:putative spermidine/putrescine transport system permease protein